MKPWQELLADFQSPRPNLLGPYTMALASATIALENATWFEAAGSKPTEHDFAGQRSQVIKRDAAGARTELVWFMGDTEAHYNAAGAVTHSYSNISLGSAVARVDRTGDTTTTTEYQFHGLAGSTLATVDQSTGTVNASFVYAPYGEVIEATDAGGVANGTSAHKRRFNDKQQDDLTGLSYYGARYYDRMLMGWTQADPLYLRVPDLAKQSTPRRSNVMTFSLNNPVRFVDPDGLDSGSSVAPWTKNSDQGGFQKDMSKQEQGAIYGGGTQAKQTDRAVAGLVQAGVNYMNAKRVEEERAAAAEQQATIRAMLPRPHPVLDRIAKAVAFGFALTVMCGPACAFQGDLIAVETVTVTDVTVTGAAAEAGGSALVKYDADFAAQQILKSPTNVTQGGRTISVHAAERMMTPPAGRAPTTMAEIDQFLDTATQVRKISPHPLGDTITLRNATAPRVKEVVVDAATGQRVITVITPKR